jgi:hypothetical protein
VRIRLYFDEDTAAHSLVRELRARGTDLSTPLEVGMLHKTDAEHLAWAALNARTIYSFNRRDFYRLHTGWLKDGRSHSGIILSRQGLSVGEQMRRLLRLLNKLTAEDMVDRIEFLSAWGSTG